MLEHLGRGHTDSDVIVRVPDAAVVFAGDLVKESGPPGYRDAFPVAWVRTAKELLDRVDGLVVPGHGDPVDRSFVTRWVATLQCTAELASAVAHDRVTTDEALARSVVHPRAMTQAIERAYLEGSPRPGSHVG